MDVLCQSNTSQMNDSSCEVAMNDNNTTILTLRILNVMNESFQNYTCIGTDDIDSTIFASASVELSELTVYSIAATQRLCHT